MASGNGAHLGGPKLWEAGEVLGTIQVLEPLLATWEANSHPSQQRMRAYLAEIEAAFSSLRLPPGRLFLHMDIDVKDPRRLVRHHDVENYLTPIIYHLGHQRFVYVSGSKRVGGGSWMTVGCAVPRAESLNTPAWGHFACHAGRGAQEKRWKVGLRDALMAAGRTLLPPGPVEAHLVWRCSPSRNWVWLWKPTGDAMGPVLGSSHPRNPFSPDDDRIVKLGLHLNSEPAMGHDVDVAMWWRLLPPEDDSLSV